MKVKFQHWDCYIEAQRYKVTENKEDIKWCLILRDMKDGAVVAFATVNLPMQVSHNEVFIKDYSENHGMVEALIEAEVILPNPIKAIHTGHVVIRSYELTLKAYEKLITPKIKF